MPVDGLEGHPAVEAEFEFAFGIFTSYVIAVLILHEWRPALWTVANLLVLNCRTNFVEILGVCLASSLVLLGFAEFAELSVAVNAIELLVGFELPTLSAFGTEEVQLEDHFVCQLIEILELHLSLKLYLAYLSAASFFQALKVLELPIAIMNSCFKVLSETGLTKTVPAIIQTDQILKSLKTAGTDISSILILLVDPHILFLDTSGHLIMFRDKQIRQDLSG